MPTLKCRVVWISIVYPIISSSLERSFSTLKRIKNYVRNSTGQERISQISLLSIEDKLLQKIVGFYDDFIGKFAKRWVIEESNYIRNNSRNVPTVPVEGGYLIKIFYKRSQRVWKILLIYTILSHKIHKSSVSVISITFKNCIKDNLSDFAFRAHSHWN